MNTATTTRNSSAGVGWINVLLGIWMIISPFVLGFTANTTALWNNVASGIAIALLALAGGAGSAFARGLNMILGAWLIVSPFVLGFSSATILWNNIVLGCLVFLVALLNPGTADVNGRQTPPPNP